MGGYFLEAQLRDGQPVQDPGTSLRSGTSPRSRDPPRGSGQADGRGGDGAAIAVLFVLPWLDRSPVRSIRYKGWLSKLWLVIFAVSFVILGYYGAQAPSPLGTTLSRVCTVLYFAFFILMPFYTRMEKTKPVPERVTG